MQIVEGKGGIYAKVVADSTANGIRLTTLELRYPRFIHSEFMTHRLFSRNASSSRAIPVEKMLEQVRTDPAMPIYWGKNKPGMQATEECDNLVADWAESEFHGIEGDGLRPREEVWRDAAYYYSSIARPFMNAQYHKQIVNRLLEPFQFIKVIVTATEWDNFFKLRLHPDAQPEMQELARVMKVAMENSTPIELEYGYWHIPYVDFYNTPEQFLEYGGLTAAIKASVARCARVSYLTHDRQQPDIKADMVLADKLLEAEHMSPFEHQASPMVCPTHNYNNRWKPLYTGESGITHVDRDGNYWSANLRGWLQYRQMI